MAAPDGDDRHGDGGLPPARLALACAAGPALVALVEAAYVLAFSAPSFDGVAERARFVVLELALAAPAAAAAALVGAAFAVLTRRVGRRARARPGA